MLARERWQTVENSLEKNTIFNEHPVQKQPINNLPLLSVKLIEEAGLPKENSQKNIILLLSFIDTQFHENSALSSIISTHTQTRYTHTHKFFLSFTNMKF